jgi:hypothetical protein
MKSSSKIVIAAVVIAAAIPVVALLAAEVIVNSEAVKSEIEGVVTETLEMEFKIDGRIDISFFPLLNLAAKNLTIGIETGQIASADQIVIHPRIWPLVDLDVEIKKAHIQQPRLTLNTRALDKIMALIKAESEEPLPIESLIIESFSISGAGLTYSDDQTRVDLDGINVRNGPVDIIADREVIFDDIYGFFKAISLTGDMTARQISSGNFNLKNLTAEITIEKGQISAESLTTEFLGSNTKFHAVLNLMQPHSTFNSTFKVTGLDMKAMAESYFPAVNIHAKVDLISGLSASGIQLEQLIDYVSGSGLTAGQKKIPIKSAILEPFTITTKDLSYSNDTITIDHAGLDLKGDQWTLIENNRGTLVDFDSFLRATRISGPASIKRLTLPNHKFESLQAEISNEHGIITADSFELKYFGEQARLGIKWNLRQPEEHIQLRVDMPALDTASLLKKAQDQDILHGKISVKGEFEYRGTDLGRFVENLDGKLTMQGANLRLKGVDFDRALDEFQKMGAYGFNDFAALITLGPLGPMVSHGYDQLAALEKMMAAKGDSTIQQIISDWNVFKGVADASDVAFSTQRHRVAVVGKLDFPNKHFQKVTIAVVDADGCIVNKEIVDGPFENPEVKDTGVIQRTLIRPLKRFLKSECVAFYNGSVAHPTTTQP